MRDGEPADRSAAHLFIDELGPKGYSIHRSQAGTAHVGCGAKPEAERAVADGSVRSDRLDGMPCPWPVPSTDGRRASVAQFTPVRNQWVLGGDIARIGGRIDPAVNWFLEGCGLALPWRRGTGGNASQEKCADTSAQEARESVDDHLSLLGGWHLSPPDFAQTMTILLGSQRYPRRDRAPMAAQYVKPR